MSDETVRVPAALVEALREALVVWGRDYISGSRGEVLTAARALVDAAERPDEGETDEPKHQRVVRQRLLNVLTDDGAGCDGGDFCDGSEAACCTDARERLASILAMSLSDLIAAPLSSPRRTRDEGSEDEAEAAWQAFMADNGIGEVRWWEREAFRTAYCQSMLDAADAIQALHPGEVKNSVIWLRARAARLAGEDDRG